MELFYLIYYFVSRPNNNGMFAFFKKISIFISTLSIIISEIVCGIYLDTVFYKELLINRNILFLHFLLYVTVGFRAQNFLYELY